MLRLYLRDVETNLTVECPNQQRGLVGGPELEWDLKTAVGELAALIANARSVPAHEVLFTSPPFLIVARWDANV